MPESVTKLAYRWILKQARISEVVYLGLFLSPMDQKKLLQKFGKLHPVVYADHMTIWYFKDGGDPNLESLPLGKSFSLKIIGYAEDEKAQAVIVRPPTKFKPKAGRVPHITLTTESGVSAQYSNILIAQSTQKSPLKGLPTITGKLGWFDGEKARFDLLRA